MKNKCSIVDVNYKFNGLEIVCNITAILPNRNKVHVSGIANCNPEDNFDEILGKHIAESRAKALMYDCCCNVALDTIENLCNPIYHSEAFERNRELLNNALNCFDKHRKLYKREVKHIGDLIHTND